MSLSTGTSLSFEDQRRRQVERARDGALTAPARAPMQAGAPAATGSGDGRPPRLPDTARQVNDLLDSAKRAATRGFDVLANRLGEGLDGMLGGIPSALSGARQAMSARAGIERLDGAGDSLYLRTTPEGKLEGSFRKFGELAVKGQLGSEIRVTRDSDATDSGYTLRYDKQALGAAAAGLGLPGKSVGGVDAKAKAEIGVQSFDAVEMHFDSREEAIRATEILQRMQTADMLDDGVQMALSGNPAARALSGLDNLASRAAGQDLTVSGGGTPLGNPLVSDGAPGGLSRRIAGVTQEDLAFLSGRVRAYETTLGTRGRLSAEVKGRLGPLDLALEGRLDGTERVTRRVELPAGSEDGRVTYSISGGLRLSAKEKLQRKQNGIFDPPATAPGRANAFLQLGADNRVELASAGLTASVSYRLPAGTEATASGGGRPWPEASALTGRDGLELEKVSLRATTEWRNESLADASRGDSLRLSETLTLHDPARLRAAAGKLFQGDWQAAAGTAGAVVEVRLDDIDRSGVAVQPTMKVGVDGLLTAEASVILEAGIDDIVGTRRMTYDPRAAEAAAPDALPLPGEGGVVDPTAPQDDGRTLVVVPAIGLNLRAAPGGRAVGTLQNGTFLRSQDEQRTDAEGRAWLKVSGTDQNDRPVEGWVAADHVRPHRSTLGAMDATGRINPSLEHERYDSVTVRKDDNLWDLARSLGVDPQAMIALNRDHLVNPSLIFAGDTVYLPGTARGPAPTEARPARPEDRAATPAFASKQPASPEAPSVTTDSTGETTGETGGATTGPAAGSGGPATGSGETSDSVPSPAPSPGPAAPPAATPALSASPQSGAADPERGRGGMSDLSGLSAPAPASAPAGPAPTGPQPGRGALDRILASYQVANGPTVDWRPDLALPGSDRVVRDLGGLFDRITGGTAGDRIADKVDRVSNMTLPAAEAASLDRLGAIGQTRWMALSDEVGERALQEFSGRQPAGMGVLSWQNDGHVDAFRHALWNARMTRAFGADWTATYATAHEMLPGNPAAREAMDLYNNEVGRRIAMENPQASDDDLARLVRAAVDNGALLVIDAEGRLQWSNRVPVGAHGSASAGELPGNPALIPALQETGS